MSSSVLRRLPLLIACAAAPAFAQPILPDAASAARAALPDAGGPELPEGFYLENAASGAVFNVPVDVAFAPDGRFFVAEKRGTVYVVVDGVKQAEPVLDLSDEVLNNRDRGLLGIALDPQFEANRRLYLTYVVDHESTDDEERLDAFARITSYALSEEEPDRADPASRRVLIGESFDTGIPACFLAHSIGSLDFGSDGTLFIGSGDGASYSGADGGGAYPECFGPGRFDSAQDVGAFRAQQLGSMAGKVLRVDPETGLGLPSNPFWTGDGADNASRVWAMGLRNPFRFSVDTAGGSTDPADGAPGTLYAGDVGWNAREEINVSLGGENFGWPCFEGIIPQNQYREAFPDGPPNDPTLACGSVVATEPEAYWSHYLVEDSYPDVTLGSSITGGEVYAGSTYPSAYHGRLFYADFSLGWMGTAIPAGTALLQHDLFSEDTGPVVSLRYDPASESMHWVNVWEGAVLRLAYAGSDDNAPPVAVAEAGPPTGDGYRSIAFDASASFDPEGDPLTFFWDFGDENTSDLAAPTHTYSAPGFYSVTLVVTDERGASARYFLSVGAGSGPPTIERLSPSDGTTVTVGSGVVLEAEATDPEGEPLTYQWTVRQIHDVHEHPDVFEAEGQAVLFDIPSHGIPGEYIGYNVVLTVTDPLGIATVQSAEIHAEYPHTLPGGWHTRAIGGPPTGGVSVDDGTFTLSGGGLPPDSTRDYVRFTYRQVGEEGHVQARVGQPDGPPESAAGLMLRTTLRADAPQAFAQVGVDGLGLRYRRDEGSAGAYAPCPAAAPREWVRLAYRPDGVEMLTSADGASWTPCAAVSLDLSGPRYAGLAVTSQHDAQAATATFRHVGGTAPFGAAPPLPTRLRLLSAYPNPARQTLHLRVEMPSTDPIGVEAFDVLGRRVLQVSDWRPGVGEATLPLRIGGLSPGTYVLRVRHGDEAVARRISVL